LGLFEHPLSDPDQLALVGSAEHRAVAQEAVSQSLVLLQNENNALPIAPDATIFVAGAAADDIGIQSGGWTIEWQGRSGNITEGTTILEAIEATATGEASYNKFGRFENFNPPADVGIVVVGEQPYAEGQGDAADLALSPADIELITRVGEQADTVIVILLSGRPLIITDALPLADAWVAAWLPGTEGQGVADNLFGLHPFTGQLSFTWPASMAQLPLGTGGDPLFPFGYGLTIGNQ
jgi:beta-glucosidase